MQFRASLVDVQLGHAHETMAQATSPYLLQHSTIRWTGGLGPEAPAEAKPSRSCSRSAMRRVTGAT